MQKKQKLYIFLRHETLYTFLEQNKKAKIFLEMKQI